MPRKRKGCAQNGHAQKKTVGSIHTHYGPGNPEKKAPEPSFANAERKV